MRAPVRPRGGMPAPRGGIFALRGGIFALRGGIFAFSAAALSLALAACAPTRTAYVPAEEAVERGRTDIRSVLVYVIHGDADYIYHDARGRRRLADADALAQAQEVARQAREAEVFIFHQKPRWHHWAHPAPDAVMFHYRRGVLLRHRAYSRSIADDGFGAEAALFRRHASARALPPETCSHGQDAPKGSSGPRRLFAYFGHEIPILGAPGYSRSRPGEDFSLADFTRGLGRFAGPSCSHAGDEPPQGAVQGAGGKPLSLVILSACRGGTPATTSALFPYADFVLASPTPLHLSYLDTRALIPLLRDSAGDAGVRSGAEAVARESFLRLQARTQTAISLVLYESGKAADYLGAHSEAWDGSGELSAGVRMHPMGFRDCAEDPGFGPGGERAGAKVFFRAGRFGFLKSKKEHSGWECPQPMEGLGKAPNPGPAGPEPAATALPADS